MTVAPGGKASSMPLTPNVNSGETESVRSQAWLKVCPPHWARGRERNEFWRAKSVALEGVTWAVK